MTRDDIDYEHRSAAMLADFTVFCQAYPRLRFWQALAAWTGMNVYVGPPASVRRAEEAGLLDTFNFEGKDR